MNDGLINSRQYIYSGGRGFINTEIFFHCIAMCQNVYLTYSFELHLDLSSKASRTAFPQYLLIFKTTVEYELKLHERTTHQQHTRVHTIEQISS